MSDEFLSEQDLAARWKMSAKTLTRWRTIRRGPPFVKLGKTVRYAVADVVEFEHRSICKPAPLCSPAVPDDPAQPDEIRLLTIRDVLADVQADVATVR